MNKLTLYISSALASLSMGILIFFVLLLADATLDLSDIGIILLSIPLNLVLMLLMVSPVIVLLLQLRTILTAINQNKPVDHIEALPLGFLGDLIHQANIMIVNQQEFQAARGRLYEQISEVAAQEERQRLARDLHDSIKQQVFSINISATAAQAHLDTNPAAAHAALSDVKQSAQEAMVEMRAMLQQLAPAPIEKYGLIGALRQQAEALSYRTGAKVETQFGQLPDDDSVPIGTQEALFRIAQEAFSNIARHARAKHVRITLDTIDNHAIALHIADDGKGFDMATIQRGMGIGNIERRVNDMKGATLKIHSVVQEGTSLHVQVPFYDAETDLDAQKQHEEHYRSLLNTTTNRYWGFAAMFSICLFMLGVVLRIVIQQSSPVMFAIALSLTVISIPVGVWFLRQFWQRRALFQEATPTQHATHNLLQNRLHQADWIAWFSLISFVNPVLFLVPDVSQWLPTGIGLLGFAAMSVHLGYVGWERYRELLRLHPLAYEKVMKDVRTSLTYGWVTIILMTGLFFLPNILAVDAEPLFIIPIQNEEQWQQLGYFVMLMMLVVYHIAITWVYRHHQTKGEDEQ